MEHISSTSVAGAILIMLWLVPNGAFERHRTAAIIGFAKEGREDGKKKKKKSLAKKTAKAEKDNVKRSQSLTSCLMSGRALHRDEYQSSGIVSMPIIDYESRTVMSVA